MIQNQSALLVLLPLAVLAGTVLTGQDAHAQSAERLPPGLDPDTSSQVLGAVGTVSSRGTASPQPANGRTYNRWQDTWDEVVSPLFLLGSAGPALGDHLGGTPASWRGDVVGYGARVGSNAGRLLLEAGGTHGIAAATRLDLRFEPRRHGGVAARLGHAALGAVTARTARGARVPNAPRILGTYAGALAQQRWEQGTIRPGAAAVSTALSLGIDMAVNVVQEFTSDR